MVAVVKKILKKCPLKYVLAQNVSWMNPTFIKATQSDNADAATKQLEKCLEHLVNAGRADATKGDIILRQYKEMVVVHRGEISAFQRGKDRLDILFYSITESYSDLWNVMRLVLTLSHGQATVERGFLQNKELVVENQTF